MEERLKKIINMAKRGDKYEKRNAILIIKKICEKKGMDFDEVMNLDQEEIKKFEFCYHGMLRKDIAFQIYFKVIGGKMVRYNKYYIFFECTQKKFEEFKIAFDEYRRIWKKELKVFSDKQRKEKKLFSRAFIQKHELFSNFTEEELEEIRAKRKKKITLQDIKDAEMMARMARDMEEEANLFKRLG